MDVEYNGERELIMIKFEHVVLPSAEQMAFDVEGMRNPLRSWKNTDSGIAVDEEEKRHIFGERDHNLAKNLALAGPEHRKFMRSMQIRVRVTAPLYW